MHPKLPTACTSIFLIRKSFLLDAFCFVLVDMFAPLLQRVHRRSLDVLAQLHQRGGHRRSQQECIYLQMLGTRQSERSRLGPTEH